MAAGTHLPLERDQANYLLNVLRLQDGADVLVFNGRDGEWRARLAQTGKKTAELILDTQARAQEPASDIHYLFAPLKHARLDYMVQKAVEMGAARLRPVLTRRTQAHRVNTERMSANVIEAAEQCGILTLPPVDEPVSLERLLANWPQDRVLIFCDEDAPAGDPVAQLRAQIQRPAKAAVLIGPEGGFDAGERALLMGMEQTIAMTLGPRILRADTAAVAAMTLVQAAIGDLCA